MKYDETGKRNKKCHSQTIGKEIRFLGKGKKDVLTPCWSW